MNLSISLPEHVAADGVFVASASDLGAATLTEQRPAQEDGDGDDDGGGGGSAFVSFLPLILIFAAVYFLLLRPRSRQMRQQRALQSSIEVGDEVLLSSGVYGFITGIEEGTGVIWVEIDDDVQIRVTRGAISSKVDTGGGAAGAGGESSTSRPTLKGGSSGGTETDQESGTG